MCAFLTPYSSTGFFASQQATSHRHLSLGTDPQAQASRSRRDLHNGINGILIGKHTSESLPSQLETITYRRGLNIGDCSPASLKQATEERLGRRRSPAASTPVVQPPLVRVVGAAARAAEVAELTRTEAGPGGQQQPMQLDFVQSLKRRTNAAGRWPPRVSNAAGEGIMPLAQMDHSYVHRSAPAWDEGPARRSFSNIHLHPHDTSSGIARHGFGATYRGARRTYSGLRYDADGALQGSGSKGFAGIY